MKSPDYHRDVFFPEFPAMSMAAQLVGLYADQADEAAALWGENSSHDFFQRQDGIKFIIGMNADFNIITENFSSDRIMGQAVQTGQ